MEKQLKQLMNNVSAFAKRIALVAISAAFVCAALITADGEAAKNVLAFKSVTLGEVTSDNYEYAYGDEKVVAFDTLQNGIDTQAALAFASLIEPEAVEMAKRDSELVAEANTSSPKVAAPSYADPSMNGYEFLGTYVTTGYCPCARCCGKTNGITANGSHATANHTIAADTRNLPFGTQVVINGQVYTVEDRGGAIKGNRIDIFFASHQEALVYGRRTVNVYRYVGPSENASEVIVETVSETPDINTTKAQASSPAVTPAPSATPSAPAVTPTKPTITQTNDVVTTEEAPSTEATEEVPGTEATSENQ